MWEDIRISKEILLHPSSATEELHNIGKIDFLNHPENQ
jgi:hypothetical protein